MEGTVHVLALFTAAAGKEEELERALTALIEPTRKEAGCIRYDLVRGLGKPAEFAFIEEWESAEHLDAHLQTAHVGEEDSLHARGADLHRALPADRIGLSARGARAGALAGPPDRGRPGRPGPWPRFPRPDPRSAPGIAPASGPSSRGAARAPLPPPRRT